MCIYSSIQQNRQPISLLRHPQDAGEEGLLDKSRLTVAQGLKGPREAKPVTLVWHKLGLGWRQCVRFLVGFWCKKPVSKMDPFHPEPWLVWPALKAVLLPYDWDKTKRMRRLNHSCSISRLGYVPQCSDKQKPSQGAERHSGKFPLSFRMSGPLVLCYLESICFMCIVALYFVFLETCIYIFVSFLPIRKEEGEEGRKDGKKRWKVQKEKEGDWSSVLRADLEYLKISIKTPVVFDPRWQIRVSITIHAQRKVQRVAVTLGSVSTNWRRCWPKQECEIADYLTDKKAVRFQNRGQRSPLWS